MKRKYKSAIMISAYFAKAWPIKSRKGGCSMSKIEKQWISIEELSEYLGISRCDHYVSGSARERTSLLSVLAVNGVFGSRILMNGLNREKAISVEMNGWMLVCCRSPHVGTPQRRMVTSSVGSFFLMRTQWLTLTF